MNIFVIKTFKIRDYEMGLCFRDGEFKGLLGRGRHWFLDPLGKVKVDVVSLREPWLVHEKLDVIVKSGAPPLIHWPPLQPSLLMVFN